MFRKRGKDLSKKMTKRIKLKELAEPAVCYVCLRTKPKVNRYIGKCKEGKKIFRHESCYPGSYRWRKSKIAKNSKLYDILNQKDFEFYKAK